MPRGRKRPAEDGPDADRRCLVTRAAAPRAGLVRFVLDPEGRVVPDLAERLPGRGFWVAADRSILRRAVDRGLFSRAAKRSVRADPDLPERVECLLAERCGEALGLARRAGAAVLGHDKVRAALESGVDGLLLEAADGAADGVRRMRGLAGGRPALSVLTAEELARPLGRDRVVHAFIVATAAGRGLIARLRRDLDRLSGFRPPPAARAATGGRHADESERGLENGAGTCIQGAATRNGHTTSG